MFVSFWAFELASAAAFARAPRRNGKARLMRLDVLMLSNLLAVAEADLDWGLARRACVLAGLNPEDVTHVQRSAPRTCAALISRARIYCTRFFGFEIAAHRLAARMMKRMRRPMGDMFGDWASDTLPRLHDHSPAARAPSCASVATAGSAQPCGGVQPRAPP
jgi:hypothetical protein